ncbi:MAG: tetratricopeptide repeat protein, partial [Planctomycetota bacterium]
NAIKYGASKEGTDFLFARWLELDSDHKDVHLAYARYLMDYGEYASAFSSAQRALALDTHDEEAFETYTRTADSFYHQSRRGSQDLLLRCISQEMLVPEVITDQHLLMPMVELAIQQGYYAIAQASALEASEIFNWARWPKYLLVQAYLEDGKAQQAIQAAEALLAFHPNDAEGIRSLRRAREMAGLPIDDLLFWLLLIGEHDEDMARALLTLAEERDDPDLEEQLARTIIRISPEDLHAHDRLAAMQYRQGELEAAQQTLAGIIELASGKDGLVAAYALSRSFLLNLLTSGDPDLASEFPPVLAAASEFPLLATELANDLEVLGFPAEASQLLEPILFRADMADTRAAVHFLLAAKLAIRDGRNSDAIAHLRSARSFEGGESANLILAVLHLRLNNGADALEALGEGPSQSLLAASLAARLGRSEVANGWARPWVARNPMDFEARILRAILDPVSEGSPWIRPIIDAAPLDVLEILINLKAEGFEGQALATTQDLLQKFPEEPMPLYLYAEALAAAGAERRALGTHALAITQNRDFSPSYMRSIRLLARIAGQKGRDLQILPRQASSVPGITIDPDYKRILSIIPRELIEMAGDDWIRTANRGDFGVAEVNFLAAVGMPRRATLLAEALTKGRAKDDLELWSSYFSIATNLFDDPEQEDLLTRVQASARANLAKNRAVAASVQFLIAKDQLDSGPLGERMDLERVERVLAWIVSHVESAADDSVNNSFGMDVSMRLLAELKTRDHAVSSLEGILAADPSNVELWMLRARWLAEKGLPEQGLAGLESILEFAPQSRAVLTVAELAARSGNVDLRHIQSMVDTLPSTLLETPQGKFSRGMLAVRAARYAEADRLLAESADQPDGAALYFRALANLSLRRPDRARQLFIDLADRYPESSLAVNAEHFANQLSH